MFKINKFTRVCGPLDLICVLMVTIGFVINFEDAPLFATIYSSVCALTIFIAVIFRARTITRANKAILLRYKKQKRIEMKKAMPAAAQRAAFEEK